jgi:transposase-like protein
MERRKFTRELKLEAVRLIKDRGVSYAQAGQDLGVHQSQLRSWMGSNAVRPELRCVLQNALFSSWFLLKDRDPPTLHKPPSPGKTRQ